MKEDERKNTLSLGELRRALINHFNESELQDLAFDLDVDYENIAGNSKGDKVRHFIDYMERRGQLSKLIQQCQNLRPLVFWPELSVEDNQAPDPFDFSTSDPVTKMRDGFSRYEVGLHLLQAQIKQNHSRYAEFLVYQQRLVENINQIRRYGDTETRRSERSEIVERLNELAVSVAGISFNDLCQ